MQNKRRNFTRRFPIIFFGIFVTLLLAVALTPNLRWRAQILYLRATGKIQDVDWGNLLMFLSPRYPLSVQRLVETRNPYAVINNPYWTVADIKAGSTVYAQQCAPCHGPTGGGGMIAPALTGGQFKHGSADWAIFRTIRFGVPNTAMPGHVLPQRQIWQLVSYVRALDGLNMAAAAKINVFSYSIPYAPVPYSELQATREPAQDWLTYSGSYSSTRHTLLTQIRPDNVRHLAPRWIHQLGGKLGWIEASPIVRHGVMFVTSLPSTVKALDATTGKVLWAFDYPLPLDAIGGEYGVSNRGVAVLDDKVFVGTGDAKLIALSAKTGAELWETPVANYKIGNYITCAPLAYRDLVVTGISNRKDRGFIVGLDVNTGKERWRFYTIPAPGEPGSDTWSGDSWRYGGAPTWLTGSYDPDQDLLYWAVGNPKPDYDPSVRRGDNLYTNAVVTLHGATGKLVWYFQFTPQDQRDWDANQIGILTDRTTDHGMVKRLLWANRNGFYYILDRDTGRFLQGTPFAKVNWTPGLDERGRPLPLPESASAQKGMLTYPGNVGATNWWSPTYDSDSDTLFVPTLDQGMVFFSGDGNNYPSDTGEPFHTGVRALNASTGKVLWDYNHEPRINDAATGGLLSTKTGLVFGGDENTFFALDAHSGKLVWSFPAGGNIRAAPVSYEVDGTQYVAIASGNNILAFALPK